MYVHKYLQYLKDKNTTENTFLAYKRDVMGFEKYCKDRNIDDLTKVENAAVVSYVLDLKESGKTSATIARKLAAIRKFYKFLIKTGVCKNNPTEDIKTPRIERKEVEYLTISEVENVLSMPNETPKGKRDRAILEVMYATGIRANELVEANLEDVNIRIGFLSCPGVAGNPRIVPLGRPSKMALEEYIYEVRNELAKEDETALFVNYQGKRLTRQGVWKILKEYGKKANLEEKFTPNILRHSFAVHMAQNGADIKSLQELLGHEDIAATQIYFTISKNRIKDVYDKAHPRA